MSKNADFSADIAINPLSINKGEYPYSNPLSPPLENQTNTQAAIYMVGGVFVLVFYLFGRGVIYGTMEQRR